jgi:hypothetical protein
MTIPLTMIVMWLGRSISLLQLRLEDAGRDVALELPASDQRDLPVRLRADDRRHALPT